MAEVAAGFVIVDTFNGGNLEDSYRCVNPTQTIPMVSQGVTKAIAGGATGATGTTNA